MTKLLLTNKDIQILTGRSEKACYRLMAKIRKHSGKDPTIPITIYEFADFMRLPPTVVAMLLQKKLSF